MQAGLSSREITTPRVPTPCQEAEGNIVVCAIASVRRTLRGLRTCACMESPCARTGRSHPFTRPPKQRSTGGSLRKGRGRTAEMNDDGKSDDPVVPAKPPNNGRKKPAEVVEERGSTKGNAIDKPHPGLSAGHGVSHALERVRTVAGSDKKVRCTALLHHVSEEHLHEAPSAHRHAGRMAFTSGARSPCLLRRSR